MRRFLAALNTPVLLALLLAVHFFLPRATESARILLLRVITAPLSAVMSAQARSVAPISSIDEDCLLRLREEYRRAYGDRRDRIFPVMDLENRQGWLIVGGGTEDGIRIGALVSSPDAVLGLVDRVTPHLARVRMLTARDVTLPIEANPRERTLPGLVPRLLGLLRGTGDGAVIEGSHLAESFQVDDELWTLPPDEGAPIPVGRIVAAGVRPGVEVLGRPECSPWVHVEGADPVDNRSAHALFEDLSFHVRLVGSGRVRGALLIGDGAGQLLPGTAVHAGARYLGRVLHVAFGTALVVRPDDPGRPLEARMMGPDGEPVAATLEGSGQGFIVRGWEGAAPPVGPVTVATRGGQELVPPGLLVGSGIWTGDRLVVPCRTAWPGEVTCSVFRHASERARLREGRR